MTTAPSTSLTGQHNNVHMDAPPKELVAGYIREAQAQLLQNNNDNNNNNSINDNEASRSISPLIEYLCLLYFEIDRFDTASIGASMELQLNGHKVTMARNKPESAFLRHIIDARCRRYTWTLRLNRLSFAHYWTTTIGIYKCRKATTKPPRTAGIFTIDGAFVGDPKGIQNVAYGFAVNKGTLVDADSGSGADSDTATQYGQRCGTGDIVAMTLDFETLELSFVINGTAYGCAFAVEDTEYRAAVNLCQEGDSIQIMKT